MLKYVAAE